MWGFDLLYPINFFNKLLFSLIIHFPLSDMYVLVYKKTRFHENSSHVIVPWFKTTSLLVLSFINNTIYTILSTSTHSQLQNMYTNILLTFHIETFQYYRTLLPFTELLFLLPFLFLTMRFLTVEKTRLSFLIFLIIQSLTVPK